MKENLFTIADSLKLAKSIAKRSGIEIKEQIGSSMPMVRNKIIYMGDPSVYSHVEYMEQLHKCIGQVCPDNDFFDTVSRDGREDTLKEIIRSMHTDRYMNGQYAGRDRQLTANYKRNFSNLQENLQAISGDDPTAAALLVLGNELRNNWQSFNKLDVPVSLQPHVDKLQSIKQDWLSLETAQDLENLLNKLKELENGEAEEEAADEGESGSDGESGDIPEQSGGPDGDGDDASEETSGDEAGDGGDEEGNGSEDSGTGEPSDDPEGHGSGSSGDSDSEEQEDQGSDGETEEAGPVHPEESGDDSGTGEGQVGSTGSGNDSGGQDLGSGEGESDSSGSGDGSDELGSDAPGSGMGDKGPGDGESETPDTATPDRSPEDGELSNGEGNAGPRGETHQLGSELPEGEGNHPALEYADTGGKLKALGILPDPLEESAYTRYVYEACTNVFVQDNRKEGQIDKYLRTQVADMLQGFRLTQSVRKYLLVLSQDRWQTGLKQGKLNGSRIAKMYCHSGSGQPRMYKKKEATRLSTDIAITLLIDNSGSMHYGDCKVITASACSIGMSEVLQSIQIPHEIILFTTGGGTKMVHSIVKDFNEPFVSRDRLLDRICRYNIRFNENGDGEAVSWAMARMMPRKEKEKLLIVLSDGEPSVCDAVGDPEQYLKDIIHEIDEAPGLDAFGIGIKTRAVKKFYKHYKVVNDLKDLEGAFMDLLKDKLLK